MTHSNQLIIHFRIAIFLFLTILVVNESFSQTTQQQRQAIQLRGLQEQARQTDEMDVNDTERVQRELIRDVRALEEPVNPDTYIVGPGDFFSLNIISFESVFVTIPVGPTGDLMIPRIGSVSIAGMKLADAVNEIRNLVSTRILDGEIYVNLERLRSFRVYLYGAVFQPGYHEITPMMRVSDLLDMTDLRQLAQLNEVRIIHKDGTESEIDLFEFKQRGDRNQNPRLIEGDQVFIPFGRLKESTVVLRGALEEGAGYSVIRPDETLRDFLNRNATYSTGADLESVTVIRTIDDSVEIITVHPEVLTDFTLRAGDEIQLIGQRSVNVHGYVATPGSFEFIPGYTAGDYLSLAGGLLPVGGLGGLKVTRVDGTVHRGEDVVIQRGDVIEVKKSFTGTLFGDVSVLNILTAAATITLAAVAAFRR
ncbi:MAG: SLBB domain-containing protein [Rhodothermaceae bacterium]|nr:SLBB domain-containing protein [Rhodothermaceae bacterium]